MTSYRVLCISAIAFTLLGGSLFYKANNGVAQSRPTSKQATAKPQPTKAPSLPAKPIAVTLVSRKENLYVLRQGANKFTTYDANKRSPSSDAWIKLYAGDIVSTGAEASAGIYPEAITRWEVFNSKNHINIFSLHPNSTVVITKAFKDSQGKKRFFLILRGGVTWSENESAEDRSAHLSSPNSPPGDPELTQGWEEQQKKRREENLKKTHTIDAASEIGSK